MQVIVIIFPSLWLNVILRFFTLSLNSKYVVYLYIIKSTKRIQNFCCLGASQFLSNNVEVLLWVYTYMNELINLQLIFSWDPLFPSFNLVLYLQWTSKMKRDCMYKYNMFLSWSCTCYCYGYSNICVLMFDGAIWHYAKYYPLISNVNAVINLSLSIYNLFQNLRYL